jgi:hemolysin activation/secretion protein
LGFSVRHGFKGSVSQRRADAGNLPVTRSGESEFTTVNFRASRYQGITDALGLYLSANGQYAFDPLLADVANRVGGEQFGRGYDPSELAGDHGLGFTAEFQYNRPAPLPYVNNVQLYTFYDVGLVWDRSRIANGVRIGGKDGSLTSTGIGVRNQLFSNIFLDLEVAFPLTRIVATEGSKDPRFFFQVVWRF